MMAQVNSLSFALTPSALPPFPIVLVIFLISLLVVMSATNWFTRRLEAICDRLDLSAGILSMLGALGANIPNYVSSIVAIAGGQPGIGLGIIIGSNIYNIAIILSISTFAARTRSGITLQLKERQDVRIIGVYSLAILLTTLVIVELIPGAPVINTLHESFGAVLLLPVVILLTLALFVALVLHIVRRPHPPHLETSRGMISSATSTIPNKTSSSPSLHRIIAEALLALVIALGAVFVMVQSGQDVTIELHIPKVLAGLLVLAVATSLPNTVVAFILARTNRAAACLEEIFSSNSINASLGIALPLLIWREAVSNDLLHLLDAPLMVALTFVALICVMTGRIGRLMGGILLVSYLTWILIHVWV